MGVVNETKTKSKRPRYAQPLQSTYRFHYSRLTLITGKYIRFVFMEMSGLGA